jgi:FAD binding domain
MPIDRREFIACAGIVAIGSACCPDGLPQFQPDRFVQFRNKFKGTVILPGDPAYDRARTPASFNPRTDKRPSFIARFMNADDIVGALEFARTQSVEVAVRAGGHDLLGASVCEGGIVIDLSQMKSIVIDREHGTARVEPGVRASDLNTATSPHGLAASRGMVVLPNWIAFAIPPSTRARFVADWCAHGASYAVGFIGGIVLCALVYRRRAKALSDVQISVI